MSTEMFPLYLGIWRSLMNLMSSLGMELKWKDEWNVWTNEVMKWRYHVFKI